MVQWRLWHRDTPVGEPFSAAQACLIAARLAAGRQSGTQ
jgi:hypothetical protein